MEPRPSLPEEPKTLQVQLPPFRALFDALPADLQTESVRAALWEAYAMEVSTMLRYALAPDCAIPLLVLHTWRQAGAQWIAEFSVSDTARPVKPEYNFHGHNVSRWCYAGAIVLESGRVSTHH